MEIDLSFTQDSVWLDKRKKAWDSIVDTVSEGLTKRKVDALRECFFEGKIPKKKIFNEGVFLVYYPDLSFNGLSHFFKRRIDDAAFGRKEQFHVEASFSLNLAYWPGTGLSDQIELFKMMYGGVYDPKRKFPFLIGNETEYRDFVYGADGLFSTLMSLFNGALFSDEMSYLSILHSDEVLTDYYICMFPYISSWIFSLQYSKEQEQLRLGGLSAKGFSSQFNKTLSYLIAPPENMTSGPYSEKKLRCIDKLKTYIESVNSPPELIERWRWAEKEYSHE